MLYCIMVESREAHVQRVASLYVLQRSRSLLLNMPGHSSALSLSQEFMLGQTGLHTSMSSAAIFSILLQTSWCTLTTNCTASPLPIRLQSRLPSTLFQTTWVLLMVTWTPSLSAHTYFKYLAQNFHMGSYSVLPTIGIFASSPISLPSFGYHLQSGQECSVIHGYLPPASCTGAVEALPLLS